MTEIVVHKDMTESVVLEDMSDLKGIVVRDALVEDWHDLADTVDLKDIVDPY